MTLLSEQGIINDVYDVTEHALRVSTTMVISGIQLSLNSAVEIKDADADTRAKVKSDGTDNGLVVILNTIPAISGTVTAKQGNRGPEPWPVSGTIVNSPVTSTFTYLTSGTTSLQGFAAATNLRLLGYSTTETGFPAASAEVVLHHGTSNAGDIVAYVKLAANESTREWLGDRGIGVSNGIYIQRSLGSTQITLYHRTEA